MSTYDYERWERRLRPAALYGLACFPFLWTLGIVANASPAVGAHVLLPPLSAIVTAWGITVVGSLTATLVVAVASLVHDRELSARSRAGWAAVLFFTTIVGGALFVLSRWRRERLAAEG
ncbi:MAG TPA: hypothetical protein VGO40_21700 [Longimicrobium sp.]|nr:hypothetical protein [Longimicrobium sp.]